MEAFEKVLTTVARATSCLALYFDEKLRVGWKTATEEQIKDEVQKVIIPKHLAKRLLSGKCVSSDAERAMVGQLKAECGDQFTCELEGILPPKKRSK
eukprot:scaffold4629_cov75-Cylindrotheca_fusiformis.AAC.2